LTAALKSTPNLKAVARDDLTGDLAMANFVLSCLVVSNLLS
jgi:hypothetical protein